MAEVPAFTIGAFRYRANAMDARQQLHIVMKFTGTLGALADSDPESPLIGFAKAISTMSTDDADFVVDACLKLVEREDKSGAAWSPVMLPSGQFMFDDLRTDLATMMQLVWPVLEANVKGFLSALPSDLSANLIARFKAKP